MSTSNLWMEPRRHWGWWWVLPSIFLVLILGLVVLWGVAVITGLAVFSPWSHPGWFFFPFGLLFFLFFLWIVFRVAWWGAGWGWGHRRWYGYGGYDSREIVRARYARGEITREQYNQMIHDLDQPSGPGLR